MILGELYMIDLKIVLKFGNSSELSDLTSCISYFQKATEYNGITEIEKYRCPEVLNVPCVLADCMRSVVDKKRLYLLS